MSSDLRDASGLRAKSCLCAFRRQFRPTSRPCGRLRPPCLCGLMRFLACASSAPRPTRNQISFSSKSLMTSRRLKVPRSTPWRSMLRAPDPYGTRAPPSLRAPRRSRRTGGGVVLMPAQRPGIFVPRFSVPPGLPLPARLRNQTGVPLLPQHGTDAALEQQIMACHIPGPTPVSSPAEGLGSPLGCCAGAALGRTLLPTIMIFPVWATMVRGFFDAGCGGGAGK